ncbi:MAG TPA: hypothetical protein PLK99_05885 [Burkholderiales bacterium]|nr:hypothetical protein [Burkholderiales bacterium]
MWDLLLYVPTVFFLALIATKFWYAGSRNLSYLIAFLASFFFLAGSNRILKTRLMAVGSAPVSVAAESDCVRIRLKSGVEIALLKEIRRYGDYAGKSFGLSGLDGKGARQQFVLHKAQFSDISEYEAIQKKIDSLRDS